MGPKRFHALFRFLYENVKQKHSSVRGFFSLVLVCFSLGIKLFYSFSAFFAVYRSVMVSQQGKPS